MHFRRLDSFCLPAPRCRAIVATPSFPPMSQNPPSLPLPLSAPRWYSAPRLWRTLKKAAARAGRKSLFTGLTLFYCMQDADTPKWAKGVIVGALGYFIFPADMIPDILPLVGYGDDLGALIAALGTVAAYVKEAHKVKAAAQVGRLIGRGNPQPPPEFIE